MTECINAFKKPLNEEEIELFEVETIILLDVGKFSHF